MLHMPKGSPICPLQRLLAITCDCMHSVVCVTLASVVRQEPACNGDPISAYRLERDDGLDGDFVVDYHGPDRVHEASGLVVSTPLVATAPRSLSLPKCQRTKKCRSVGADNRCKPKKPALAERAGVPVPGVRQQRGGQGYVRPRAGGHHGGDAPDGPAAALAKRRQPDDGDADVGPARQRRRQRRHRVSRHRRSSCVQWQL